MPSTQYPLRGTPPPPSAPDLELDAPAKVNLFLEVIAKRPDGYHEIETVMQAVDLCDRLSFWSRGDGEVTISVSGGDAPADDSNLAVRAARAVMQGSGTHGGVHLHIEKRVPSGGGMGGGSSDAAAVLRGLNRLWSLGASTADLGKLGAALGSDVNFFLHGGLALCRGRGEVVEPLPAGPEMGLLLHFPRVHIATAGIYGSLGRSLTGPRISSTNLVAKLLRGDLAGAGDELFNRLEEPVFAAHPGLAVAKERLRGSRALGALLSGSGSTIYSMAAPGDLDELIRELPSSLRREDLCPVRPVKGWE
ncbi:MAG TPA: 4-(cytidine 5'-diphospho)-2-C-methyl-D-erythritol kinase [Planctomycetota bacterium]|nr:4-(cytidine 5'-diphospho)-2-C-methyl-D-erythritol kinase [Planctomycetota bacterium]